MRVLANTSATLYITFASLSFVAQNQKIFLNGNNLGRKKIQLHHTPLHHPQKEKTKRTLLCACPTHSLTT